MKYAHSIETLVVHLNVKRHIHIADMDKLHVI